MEITKSLLPKYFITQSLNYLKLSQNIFLFEFKVYTVQFSSKKFVRTIPSISKFLFFNEYNYNGKIK